MNKNELLKPKIDVVEQISEATELSIEEIEKIKEGC